MNIEQGMSNIEVNGKSEKKKFDLEEHVIDFDIQYSVFNIRYSK